VDIAHKVVCILIQLDFPLVELARIHDLVDQLADAFHTLGRVGNFEFLKVLHLASVTCEIFRQRGISAAFWREVEASIPEIYKKEWLVLIHEINFVLSLQVLNH
jgi:hypothetical protein